MSGCRSHSWSRHRARAWGADGWQNRSERSDCHDHEGQTLAPDRAAWTRRLDPSPPRDHDHPSASGTPVPASAPTRRRRPGHRPRRDPRLQRARARRAGPQSAGGRPRRISDDDSRLASRRPPPIRRPSVPFTQWSLRKLAAHLAHNHGNRRVPVGREWLRLILRLEPSRQPPAFGRGLGVWSGASPRGSGGPQRPRVCPVVTSVRREGVRAIAGSPLLPAVDELDGCSVDGVRVGGAQEVLTAFDDPQFGTSGVGEHSDLLLGVGD